MDPFPTSVDDLKYMIWDLWDEMDLTDHIPHIEETNLKLQEVIDKRDCATKY